MPDFTSKLQKIKCGNGQKFLVTVLMGGVAAGTANLAKDNTEAFWRMDNYNVIASRRGQGIPYALTYAMLNTIRTKRGTSAIIPSCHDGMLGVGATGFTEMPGSRMMKNGVLHQASFETNNVATTLLAITVKMSNPPYNLNYVVNDEGCSCCYITTAVCKSLQLPDDCAELSMLRRFRDEVLLQTEQGVDDVQQYYTLAPDIVAAINSRADAAGIYADLNRRYIQPSIAALALGEHGLPHQLFRAMIEETGGQYL
ncbi:MAG: CFI-box-CTERM domain-containing protein [Pseudomonadota bacterium]